MSKSDYTEYILRFSFGKDSFKTLDVIFSRGLPLDRITTTDVWATDTVPSWLPPMDEFKTKAEDWIWSRYRMEVEHLCAMNPDGTKKTYEQMFYHVPNRRSQSVQVERESGPPAALPEYRQQGTITGFPPNTGYNYCQKLKIVRTPHQRISVGNGSYLVSKTQSQSADHKDYQHRSPVGAKSSRSTMSEPLFQ